MPYRHKGSISTLVVRINSHYSFGESLESIPQDPWATISNFSSFLVFTLVFRNVSLDLFKSTLFPVSGSAESSARPS